MAEKLDYKKSFKELYQPARKPHLIDVPEMRFSWVAGQGAPASADYQEALGLLYAVSWTIKMSHKSGQALPGFHEYTVPPLEGLWSSAGTFDLVRKDQLRWVSLIRQPDFVDEQAFAWARETAQRKKPELDFSRAHFTIWREGLCVQCPHVGPYDDEPATFAAMRAFVAAEGLRIEENPDTARPARRHHEIYLNDPRKTKPENLKTVLRLPVCA